MNTILNAHFTRLDTALTTLLDSISSYNPSPQAAIALIQADEDLSKGLEQLSTHQANAARLAELQALTASLSTQITQTLTLLSTTRSAILATPSTAPTSTSTKRPAAPVNADELLQYAKRISKFTVPPTRRAFHNDGNSTTAAATPAAETVQTGRDSNGTASPVEGVAPNGDISTAAAGAGALNTGTGSATADPAQKTAAAEAAAATGLPDGAAQPDKTPGPSGGPSGDPGSGMALTALQQHESQWVNPEKPPWFIPWPTDEVIRRGGLASLQAGIVPGPRDGEDGKGGGDEEVEMEDEEGGGARERDERHADAGRRTSSGGVKREEKKPAVFSGLDLYDPDDD